MTQPEDRPSAVRWVEQHALAVGLSGLLAMLAAIVVVIAVLTDDADPPVQPEESRAPVADDDRDVVVAVEENARPAPASTLTAVKIDNAPAARPQIGLNSARFIFEVPVEGGLTRFLAFFEPNAPVLAGPVRSVRPVDAALVPVLSSTLISTGGQPFVLQTLSANGTQLVGDTGEFSPFEFLDRPSPHHMFMDLSSINPGPVPLGLPLADSLVGTEASSVVVPYPNEVAWTFEENRYVRSEDGEASQVVSEPGAEPEPLTADTVVILSAARRPAGYQDSAGAEVPTFDVVGGGNLRIFHAGTVTEGTWSRAALADPFRFQTADGSPLGIPPGRTFIHVLRREAVPEY